MPANLAERFEGERRFVESIADSCALSERRAAYLGRLKKGDAVYLHRYREHCVVRKVDLIKRSVTVLYRQLPVELPLEEVQLPAAGG